MPSCLRFIHERIHGRLVVFAALPQYLNAFPSRAACFYPCAYGLVQCAAAQAASYYEQVPFPGVESIVSEGFLPCLFRGRDNLLPDGIPCLHDFLCGKEAFHAVIGYAYPVHFPAEYLVCKSGESVLLLDQGRDAFAACAPEQRGAGVSSHAYGDVGPEAVYDLPCHPYAFYHLERQGEIRQCEPSLQPGHRQPRDFVARCRHFFHFHPAFRTHEQYLCLRVHGLEPAGDRDCREYVASGASS